MKKINVAEEQLKIPRLRETCDCSIGILKYTLLTSETRKPKRSVCKSSTCVTLHKQTMLICICYVSSVKCFMLHYVCSVNWPL